MAKSVLIVEDEVLVALDIEATVREAGYVVVGPASRESAALELLESHPCDLALLDANLGPGGNVEAVATALRSRGIPFAFVSGYARDSLPPAFHDVQLLPKPFDPDQLKLLLARLAA